MSDESIQLQEEIYREDVEKLADWMEDERVVRYLNEEQNIHDRLRRMLSRSTLPFFSAQLNNNGRFFLIAHQGDESIGFLRLIPKSEGTEMVVVIGDRSFWGHGLGLKAIRQGLRQAFFEWREDKVIAKIARQNERSRHVFQKAGFTRDKALNGEIKYSITLSEFL